MSDRKYGRMFTMADLEKIGERLLEEADTHGVTVGRVLQKMDDEGVRFKFGKDEPTFTFRARDERAVAGIRYYEDHQSPNAPVGFLEGVAAARRDFERFRDEYPELMKQPD